MKKWLLFILKYFTCIALSMASGFFLFMGDVINVRYYIPAGIMFVLAVLNSYYMIEEEKD